MSKIVLIFGLLIIPFSQLAQTSNLDWAKVYGDEDRVVPSKTVTSISGSHYTIGSHNGKVDLHTDTNASLIYNASSNNSNYYDMYIQKVNSDGSFAWAFAIPSRAILASGRGICVDSQSNIYVTGQTYSFRDFDPSPAPGDTALSPINNSIFIAKYDSSGNFIWLKTIYGSQNRNGSIALQNNSLYIYGNFQTACDMDPSPTSTYMLSGGQIEHFILNLDTAGNFRWAKSFGGKFDDNAGAMTLDANGDILITGLFRDTADFQTDSNLTFNLVASGSIDVDPFVAKFDSLGNFIWAQQFVSYGSADIMNGISTDSKNNVYVSGIVGGGLDVDPSSATHYISRTNGYNDGFLVKLDSVGDFKWAYVMNSPHYSKANQVCNDQRDNVYLTGYFRDSVDFDPGNAVHNKYANSGSDIFILMLDSSGNLGWVHQMGNNVIGGSEGIGVYVNENDDLIATGIYKAAMDFDPTPAVLMLPSYSLGGGVNAYILKFSQCFPSLDIVYLTACDSIVLPGNTDTLFSNGVVTDTFLNSKGCDSVMRYYVTIHNSTSNSITQMGCDSLIINGQTFISSGVYTQTFVNTQNCDSILTLNLTINSHTVDTLTQTACNSYTLNGQTYSSSGTYTQMLQNNQGCDSILTINLTINSTTASATANGLTLSASPAGSTYQWIHCNPYSLIAGETNQTYTVTANGEYACVVTQNGCSDTSNCIKFTNVGLNELELQGISIYPNPTSKTFGIKSTNDLDNASMQIFNPLGQIIYRKEKMSGKKFEVDISKLANGIYTLELREGERVSRVKVLKQ